MANLDLVGIDLAKNVFQLHGCSSTGEVIFRKQVKRSKLLSFISELPKCTIAMEACSGSHYWGREFEALGVRLHKGTKSPMEPRAVVLFSKGFFWRDFCFNFRTKLKNTKTSMKSVP